MKPAILALVGERSGLFRVVGAYRLDGFGDRKSWPRLTIERLDEIETLVRQCDPQFLRELKLLLVALDHPAKWSV